MSLVRGYRSESIAERVEGSELSGFKAWVFKVVGHWALGVSGSWRCCLAWVRFRTQGLRFERAERMQTHKVAMASSQLPGSRLSFSRVFRETECPKLKDKPSTP